MTAPPVAAPPPTVQVWGMMNGVIVTRMIDTVLEHRLADLVAEDPRTSAELADATGLHEPSLYRLMRSCTGLGIFTEDAAGRFGLGPLGDATRQFPAMPWVFDCLSELPRSVATGETGVQHAFGVELFDFLTANPDKGADFDRCMGLIHAGEPEEVLDAYDLAGVHTLVDVGGGNGRFLAAALARHPGMHGVLLDLPPVVGRGSPVLAEHAGRYDVVGGDFFAAVAPGGDAYLLSHILHDWSDERCGVILRNIREAMDEGARLLVVEMVMPPGDAMHPAKMLDMVMLVANGAGKERTEAQYAELLDANGFRLERVVATASPVSVVEARPT